jgi:hypothetical protein
LARGWESKAVADQIEESSDLREQSPTRSRSTEERKLQERLTSLKLSKSRLLEQLERARHPVHREGLLKGLRAIESEIDRLMSQFTS